MRRRSTTRSSLPRLERLLLDGDVNAYLERYLTTIGFDVLFATGVDVDIQDDTAVLKWARRHRRIMVCHDKFRDGQTRLRLFREVHDNGGQIIRIGGKPDQNPLTSLGKIIVHRQDWLDFFADNDGMVIVHMTGMKRMPRGYLLRQIQNVMFDPTDALQQPRRPRKRVPRRKSPPAGQGKLPIDTEE